MTWCDDFAKLRSIIDDYDDVIVFLVNQDKTPTIKNWQNVGQHLDTVQDGLESGKFKLGYVPSSLGLIVFDRDTDTMEMAQEADQFIESLTSKKLVFSVASAQVNRCHYFFYADLPANLKLTKCLWGKDGRRYGEVIHSQSYIIDHVGETTRQLFDALSQRSADSDQVTFGDVNRFKLIKEDRSTVIDKKTTTRSHKNPKLKVVKAKTSELPILSGSEGTGTFDDDLETAITKINFDVPYPEWIERIWACQAVGIDMVTIVKFACTDGQVNCETIAKKTMQYFDVDRTPPQKFWFYVTGVVGLPDQINDDGTILVNDTGRRVTDMVNCIEAVGIEFRLNMLGEMTEVKFPESAVDKGLRHTWLPWNDRYDAIIEMLIEQKTYSVEIRNKQFRKRPWSVANIYRQQAYNVMMQRNRYHPFRDYLNSLRSLDEMNAETNDNRHVNTDTDLMTIVSLIFKLSPTITDDQTQAQYMFYWFRTLCLGIISRTMNPGTSFPIFLTMIGPSGCGKSLLLKLLIPPWLEGLVIDGVDLTIDPNRLLPHCQTAVIAECSEMVDLRHPRSAERFKTNVSSCDEMVRLPYAKYPMRLRRNSIFVGTSNDEECFPSSPDVDRRPVILPIERSVVNENEVYNNLSTMMTFYRDRVWRFFLDQYRNEQARGNLSEWPEHLTVIRKCLTEQALLKERTVRYVLVEALGTSDNPKIDDAHEKGISLETIATSYGRVTEGRVVPTAQELGSALRSLGWIRKHSNLGNRWYPIPQPQPQH